MEKVSVIGMDLGDKNNKAVGLAENGEIVDRTEVLHAGWCSSAPEVAPRRVARDRNGDALSVDQPPGH